MADGTAPVPGPVEAAAPAPAPPRPADGAGAGAGGRDRSRAQARRPAHGTDHGENLVDPEGLAQTDRRPGLEGGRRLLTLIRADREQDRRGGAGLRGADRPDHGHSIDNRKVRGEKHRGRCEAPDFHQRQRPVRDDGDLDPLVPQRGQQLVVRLAVRDEQQRTAAEIGLRQDRRAGPQGAGRRLCFRGSGNPGGPQPNRPEM
ncbi:LigA [Parafrankia sp. EUN1f]|nr:LigA [Parafrankia sp. EUN1f]